jgi:hypothetical protein
MTSVVEVCAPPASARQFDGKIRHAARGDLFPGCLCPVQQTGGMGDGVLDQF